MLFKRQAISSLLLELDSDDLPQSKRGQISNCLAQEVMELIPCLDCATPLLDREKQIIEKRGRDPQKYLMDSDIGTNDVLKKFYKSIYYDKEGKKQIVPDLTISELMLMLGVFDSILKSRESKQEAYTRELKNIRKRTSKKYSYFKDKKNGLDELDGLFRREEKIEEDNTEEMALIALLDENMQLIEHEIYRALGTCEEQLSEQAISKIGYRSEGLAKSYGKIALEMKIRSREIPNVFDDTLLLERCGEDSEELFKIYAPHQQQAKFDKLLQYKK